jgi:hypothetical protein
MVVLAMMAPLAHPGHGHGPGGAELAAIAIAAMVIPLVVLGVVAWLFWRSAKRDSAAGRGGHREMPS